MRVATALAIALRQIRQRVRALDEFSQPRFDSRAREKIAKDIDLLFQLRVRYRFDELFRGSGRGAIEFPHLSGSGTRHSQRIALSCDLADEPSGLRFCRIDAAAGEQ